MELRPRGPASLQSADLGIEHPSMPTLNLEQAVQFAVEHETPWSRETGNSWGIHHLDPPPWNRLLGPVHSRGPVSGTIVVDGRTLTSWGEPERADLTFSVAKTYLALLAGVAHDRGLLPDVDEPVGVRVPGIGFDAGRNAQVTWEHLLQQTSEWEGECFGVPDQVDRYRTVQFQGGVAAGKKGDPRPLEAPGTHWEYNDVRINQLSLALLHLFGRPLPEVFRESIMQPIGASERWRWVGYDNAWVDIGGRKVQSVPGGTHWGGGVSIGSIDQARVGQLLLDDGRANGRQVISREWIAAHAITLRDRALLRLSHLAQPCAARIPQRAGVELLRDRRRQLVHLDRAGAPHGAGGALDRRGLRRRILWPCAASARQLDAIAIRRLRAEETRIRMQG